VHGFGIKVSKLQLDVVQEVYNLLLFLPPEADNLTDMNGFGLSRGLSEHFPVKETHHYT